MQDPQGARTRLASLDLMRGIAALLVMDWHFPYPPGSSSLFGRAYLSVDLFFILSGFVIANAYHEWLMGRGSPAQFLRARVIRLYPLYQWRRSRRR